MFDVTFNVSGHVAQVIQNIHLNKVYNSDAEWEKEHERETHRKQVVKQKMNESPLFSSWQYGNPLVGLTENVTITSENGEKHKVALIFASKNYMDMFGIQLKEGRGYNCPRETESSYSILTKPS